MTKRIHKKAIVQRSENADETCYTGEPGEGQIWIGKDGSVKVIPCNRVVIQSYARQRRIPLKTGPAAFSVQLLCEWIGPIRKNDAGSFDPSLAEDILDDLENREDLEATPEHPNQGSEPLPRRENGSPGASPAAWWRVIKLELLDGIAKRDKPRLRRLMNCILDACKPHEVVKLHLSEEHEEVRLAIKAFVDETKQVPSRADVRVRLEQARGLKTKGKSNRMPESSLTRLLEDLGFGWLPKARPWHHQTRKQSSSQKSASKS